jgi:hypothetical protein
MHEAPTMTTAAEKLEEIIKDFEKRTKTDTENPGQALRDLIKTSPELQKMLESAVDKGELKQFGALPAGANAGGQYSGTTMELPIERLNKAAKDSAAANEIVFTVGHEIRHGLNNAEEAKKIKEFTSSVDAIAKVKGSKHDYTEAVGKIIQHYRENEASAHISGWNSLASKIAKEKPGATLQDMYDANPFRMKDFIDRTGDAPNYKYDLKKGLSIDEKTLQMPLNKDNTKAMGDYYFDKPLSKGTLGTNGNQNYPNYYGDWALNTVKAYEKSYADHYKKTDSKYASPEVDVNLGALGLSKTVLTTTLAYTDTTPAKKETEPGKDKAEAAPAKSGGKPIEASDLQESKLYRQAVDGLQKSGAESFGIKDGEELKNVAMRLAFNAEKAGMTEIEGVTKGKDDRAIAYQANGTSGDINRVEVVVGQAKTQSAANTMQEFTQLQAVKQPDASVVQKAQAM